MAGLPANCVVQAASGQTFTVIVSWYVPGCREAPGLAVTWAVADAPDTCGVETPRIPLLVNNTVAYTAAGLPLTEPDS